jgi:hypothetical protein
MGLNAHPATAATSPRVGGAEAPARHRAKRADFEMGSNAGRDGLQRAAAELLRALGADVERSH